jgi:hypothetical protein
MELDPLLPAGTSLITNRSRRSASSTEREVRKQSSESNHADNTTEALKSLLIIDRTPEPVPLEERPIEELSREEMQELLRRQRVRTQPLPYTSNLQLT